MAIACKCERCGKFYEPNQNNEACVPTQTKSFVFNTITLNHKNYSNDSVTRVGFTQMDICPTCALSFAMWWVNSKNTNNIMITNDGDTKIIYA
mgnify:CR=1 FL=1